MAGSTIIPTETKKTAPKKSFSGRTTFSIRTINPVSESTDPIRKAPRAEENPEAVASQTMPKHMPTVIRSSISSFKNEVSFFKTVGTI